MLKIGMGLPETGFFSACISLAMFLFFSGVRLRSETVQGHKIGRGPLDIDGCFRGNSNATLFCKRGLGR